MPLPIKLLLSRSEAGGRRNDTTHYTDKLKARRGVSGAVFAGSARLQ